MTVSPDTIVALSSGTLPSGVAVVRISGVRVRALLETFVGSLPIARTATLRTICHPRTGERIDEGLVLFFDGPNSFTGEDCAEFQVHGGPAVVSSLLDALVEADGVRLAEAGEFSRRAFENGRLDLTEIEGLSDLIVAQTEAQRKLALSQSQGELRDLYEGWRKQLIHMRAMIEAELDFAEEEDVPTDISEAGLRQISIVSREIEAHLDDNNAGEIIRDGFQIALMGKPNAGKSSLLNALARREVAIVTDEAGTTRDVIDVDLDIGGYAVKISDTAGIRETSNKVEQEGVRRAERRGQEADLVIWLVEKDDHEELEISTYKNAIVLTSKDDCGEEESGSISSRTGYGFDELVATIGREIENRIGSREAGLVTRKRYRIALEECLSHMNAAAGDQVSDVELRAESLRLAGDCLGRITGRIDVEDLLDVIFSEFCVGK